MCPPAPSWSRRPPPSPRCADLTATSTARPEREKAPRSQGPRKATSVAKPRCESASGQAGVLALTIVHASASPCGSGLGVCRTLTMQPMAALMWRLSRGRALVGDRTRKRGSSGKPASGTPFPRAFQEFDLTVDEDAPAPEPDPSGYPVEGKRVRRTVRRRMARGATAQPEPGSPAKSAPLPRDARRVTLENMTDVPPAKKSPRRSTPAKLGTRRGLRR
jgi:hypothetical protein